MQFRDGVFVVTEDRGCPLYNVGDEFRIKGMTLSVSRNKQTCLSLAAELMPLLAVEQSRTSRGKKNQGRSECGGCEGLIRFDQRKSGKFTTLQMRLLAAAERQAHMYRSDNGFAVLRKLPAFAELEDADLHAFCSAGQVQHFNPGERVVSNGELADRIFIMLSGRVMQSEQGQAEQTEKVVELAPGELIGELSLVSDTVYPFDYYCLEPATLLVFPVSLVKTFLAKTPALHVFFYHQLARRVDRVGSVRMDGAAGGFSASLKEIAVVDLCQLINSSRKTGRVLLSLDDDSKGELLFVGGELVQARHENRAGKHAFFQLLGRNDGTFNFVANGLNDAEMAMPVVGGFMGLVMEGMQQLDERQSRSR